MSRLMKEIMEKLAEHLDGGSWPDMETYYQARRLYYRLRLVDEREREKAEREDLDPKDSYGGNE